MMSKRAKAAVVLSAAVGIAGAVAGPASAKSPSTITMTIGDASSPIQSFSWGASNPVTIGAGSGAATGRVSISSFNVMRSADATTPLLFERNATGTAIPKVSFAFVNGAFTQYYCLANAYVESVQQSASITDDRPTDSVSFAFERIATKVGSSAFSWDLTDPDATTDVC